MHIILNQCSASIFLLYLKSCLRLIMQKFYFLIPCPSFSKVCSKPVKLFFKAWKTYIIQLQPSEWANGNHDIPNIYIVFQVLIPVNSYSWCEICLRSENAEGRLENVLTGICDTDLYSLFRCRKYHSFNFLC